MIQPQPNPEWIELPRAGCKNVMSRVLFASDKLVLANLRFSSEATIDNHRAPYEIEVICISGSGLTSIEDSVFSISEGENIHWPRNKQHCLWTDGEEMETIMVERYVD